VKFAEQNSRFLPFLDGMYGRYLKDSEFQDSEYEVHQVGLKDPGSQNFRTLDFKGEVVGV
jgi:hypothetical protein